MPDNFTITPTIVIVVLLALAGGVTTILTMVEKIAGLVQAGRKPNKELTARMDDFEDWRRDVDRKLDADKKHLDSIDACNQASMGALLALLDHGIDGNNIKQMEAAKEGLQRHLIGRSYPG